MNDHQTSTSKASLLIVDDTDANLHLLARILARQEYKVQTANSGPMALATAQTEPPDLILLDIMMPGMDGYEVCKLLKADKRTRDIPVIFVSAISEVLDKVTAFSVGGVDYITKPFQGMEVLARVETHLALRATQKSLQEKNAQLHRVNTKLTREIAERKQAEKKLHQRTRQLALINHASQVFSSTLRLDQVLQIVLEEMHRLLDIVATSFWLRVPKTGELICRQATGPGRDKILGWRLAPGQGTTGQAAQSGEPLIVVDTLTEKQHFEDVDKEIGLELRSLINIPLRAKGEVIGVLNLVDTKVGRFTSDDLRLLEPIAAAAASAIENARLFDETRKLSRAIEQSGSTVVITNLAGTIEFVNPAFFRVTGYSPEEAIGKDFGMLKSKNLSSEVYKDMWTTITRGEVWEGELLNEKKNGELFWEFATISPVKNQAGKTTHYVAIKEDITQRKQAEEDLHKALEQLEARVDELGTLNLIIQTVATVTDLEAALHIVTRIMTGLFNARTTGLALLNTTRTELTIIASFSQNKDVSGMADAVMPLSNNPSFSKVAKTGQAIVVSQIQINLLPKSTRKPEYIRPTQCLMIIPLLTRGEVIGIICVDTDQTDLVFSPAEVLLAETIAGQIAGAIENARLFEEEQHQRQLAEQALAELKVANASLKASNAELDAFAHTVAHDLKNPLGVVMGYADILVNDAYQMEPEQFNMFLQTIRRTGRKAVSIIQELLLLAGVRRENVTIAPLDMVNIVKQAQERLTLMMNECQGEIILPDVWPVAKGYAPWVEEVWTNYLSNGLKYGGQPPRLKLGATPQPDGMIRFWVQDNGPGLTPEVQASLFTEFTRLNEVRVEGHGLGLSIVQRIVDKLGGQVGVESEGMPGQGSVFYFTLPNTDKAG